MRPIYNEFYASQPYTHFRAHFQRLLQRQYRQRCFWLVAEQEAVLVGNGQLLVYPHGAELANLGVAVAHRNQGVGTGMIQVLVAIARHIGLESLEIGVAVGNRKAQALYFRLGFVFDREFQLAGQAPALVLRQELSPDK